MTDNKAATPDKDPTSSHDEAADPQATAGVKSRLTDAQKEMLASKSRGGGAGTQSVGSNHKPTQASGKLGPAQKKVRW